MSKWDRPPGLSALFALLAYATLAAWASKFWAVTIPQVAIFVLLSVWFWREGGAGLRTAFPLAPLAFAVLLGLTQLLTSRSVYAFATEEAALEWLAALCVCTLSLQLLRRREDRTLFLKRLLYFGFGLSVISVLQYYSSPYRVFWLFPIRFARALGPFVYHNQYAAVMELLIPIAGYAALTERRHKLMHWGMAAVMFSTVVAGASRTGTALILAEMPLMLVICFARREIHAKTAALAMVQITVLVAAATAISGWENIWNKFQQHDPYRERREIVLSTLRMIQDRPIAGFGLGTWPSVYTEYARFDPGLRVNRAHNDWLEWGVEGGIPLMAAMLALALWAAWQTRRQPWALGMLAVFAHCWMDYPTREPVVLLLLCAVAGALAATQPRTSSTTWHFQYQTDRHEISPPAFPDIMRGR